MKIPFNKNLTKQYHSVECESIICQFRGQCANHFTAGDFRSEGGFSPILSIRNGEVHCDTADQERDPDIISQLIPIDSYHLKSGCVCWKDICETVDFYEI